MSWTGDLFLDGVRQALSTGVGSTVARIEAAANGQLFGYSNPSFALQDSKAGGLYATVDPLSGAPLAHGYIEQDQNFWRTSGQSQGYRCNFLFNPVAIDVTYQAHRGLLPSNVQTPGQNAAAPLISSMQTISFDLQFDRTYETLRGSTTQGVYSDIGALERVGGIQRGAGSYYGGQGPLLPIPINVFFGPPTRSLAWYGFLAGMSVRYDMFTSQMVPTRAIATVNVSQLVKVNGQTKDPQTDTAPASDSTAVSP